MLSVAVLSGCSLWTLNINNYLNQVVAQIGNNITITKEDLRRGWFSFGYQFVEQGQTVEQAVRRTLDILIDRAFVLDYAQNTNDKDAAGNDRKVILTQAQENDVWQSVYDYFNGEIQKQEREVMRERNMTEAKITDGNAADTGVVYAPYKKSYIIDKDGQLQKISVDVRIDNHSIAPGSTAAEIFNNFKNKYWVYINNSVRQEALGNYITQLRNNERDRGFSTIDAEVFQRELQKAHRVYRENKILEAFQENFTKNVTVTNELAVRYFIDTFNSQAAQHANWMQGYNDAMRSNAGDLFYTANLDWFRVSHILLPFSEADKLKMSNLKTALDNMKILQADYDIELQKIYDNIEVVEYNEDGEKVGTKLATTVLTELKQKLTGKDYFTRTAIFNEFIYRYNTDPGVQNAEFNYYIPVNSDFDTMVEPFANESRVLHDNGFMGAISDLVETDYGFHIIFYVGGLEIPSPSWLTSVNEVTKEIIYHVYPLDAYRLNALSPAKTYLDKAIEGVALDSYYDYETLLVRSLKAKHEVKIWEAYIKDMWQ